jgi:hypothetical protein
MALDVNLFDAAVVGAQTGHRPRRETIVELILVIDVGQCIPLGRRLQRHDDHVIVEAEQVVDEVLAHLLRRRVLRPHRPVLRQRVRIPAVHGHEMYGIVPEPERALRS